MLRMIDALDGQGGVTLIYGTTSEADEQFIAETFSKRDTKASCKYGKEVLDSKQGKLCVIG